MKKIINTILLGFFLFATVSLTFELFAQTEMTLLYSVSNQVDPPTPEMSALIKYLLSLVSGLIAVFLKKILKKIWPGLDLD